MTSLQLLAKFREKFGDERTKKFVLELHRRSRSLGRLMFWQESMLDEFFLQGGVAPLDFPGVLDAFNVCPVHHLELVEGTAPIVYGTPKRLGKAELEHAENVYPFAGMMVVGSCWGGTETEASVFYCSACREAFRSEGGCSQAGFRAGV